MNVKITSVKQVTESWIKIKYLDEEGFGEKISLKDDEYTAYINNDVEYFRDKIAKLRDSYRHQYNELVEHIKEYSKPASWGEYATNSTHELAEELEGCSYLIKRCYIVIQAMTDNVVKE